MTDENPQEETFWTKDMIFLALLNVVFMFAIVVMLWMLIPPFASSIMGWIYKFFKV
jgi:F0F1-type ATP synthase membrane subunit c/vacuolar-type H+-ATPase subunit K